MLDERRHEVTALAARVAFARERERSAAARLERAKSRLLARPAMLLLPFGAGALGTALFLRRGAGTPSGDVPAPAERAARAERREKVAWASLLSSAMTLWNTTRPLWQSLQDPRTREAVTGTLAGLRRGPVASAPPGRSADAAVPDDVAAAHARGGPRPDAPPASRVG